MHIVSGSTNASRMWVMAVSGVAYNFSTVNNVGNIVYTGPGIGTDTLIVTGSDGPYTYSWNTVPVQTTAIATGLSYIYLHNCRCSGMYNH